MSRPIQKGSTNQSIVVRFIDSGDGTPETGVVAATAGLDIEYRREGEATNNITTITNLALLTTAHTDGGILHIGNGYYRVDVDDAAFATGAGENGVLIHGTATGMIMIGCYIPLVDYDPYDAVNLGISALPAIAAGAAGGLPDDTDSSGRVRIVDGTGAGELDTASGAVTTGTIAANAITASAYAVGAIEADAFAAGAIDASAIAANAIGSSELATDAIGDAQIATGAIASTAFAAGAIDAAAIGTAAIDADAIAANAIGASELAADAVTEIRDAVVGEAADVWSASSRTLTGIAAGVLAADSITSGTIDASFGNEVAAAVWDESASTRLTLGSMGQLLNALTPTTGTVSDAGPLAGDFDTAGFTEATNNHFNGHVLIFTDATSPLYRQARIITTYTGAGQNCAFDRAFTEAPANGDEFAILGPLAGGLGRLIVTESDGMAHSDVKEHLGVAVPAFVGGRYDVDVGDITGTSVIAVAQFDGAAIDNTVLATDAIGASQIAAAAITSSEAPNLDAAISTIATPAQVATEMSDALRTDTVTLPGQTGPPLTPTFEEMIAWLYKVLRNRKDQTSTTWQLYADNETTVDAKATVSDDATTAIKQEIVSGP